MPSYDSSRHRLRLADRHIAVLGYLAEAADLPEELAESLGELAAAGLVGESAEVSPVLGDLVLTLANPVVLVQTEITGDHGLLTSGIVVGDDATVAHEGWPGEEESEYAVIAPATLVWELARQVDLRDKSAPETAQPGVARIETTMGVLDAAFVAGGALPPEASADLASARIREVLAEAGGVREPELSQFADLVTHLTCTWRITTAWRGQEGEPETRARGIAVWDCGPYGYWQRELPAEPVLEGQVGPDSALRLAHVPAGKLWDMIADLLPDEADLRRPGA